MQNSKKKISITLAHKQRIYSTHTYDLNIPWLPIAMIEEHIVPGMAHLSLIMADVKSYMMK